MICTVPGKVILFGEHAVVYDRLGIAGAVDERVTVKVSEGKNGVELIRQLAPKKTVFSKEKLFGKLELFRRLYAEKEFDSLKAMSFVDSLMVVAAETMDRFGYKDARIELSFRHAMTGIGRSASKSAGIAMAFANFLGKEIRKKEIAEIAYLGDVVAHGGTPSGIDTSTVTYGGYVSYRKSQGVKTLEINQQLPLVLVNSGDPSKTSVTVPAVRRLRQQNQESVDKILDEIDSISLKAIDLLKTNSLGEIGKLMNRNHILLKQLGVSTKKLDSLCGLAIANGALGAKLTGGGGGGGMIALASDEKAAKKLRNAYEARGFKALKTSLGVEGARLETKG